MKEKVRGTKKMFDKKIKIKKKIGKKSVRKKIGWREKRENI